MIDNLSAFCILSIDPTDEHALALTQIIDRADVLSFRRPEAAVSMLRKRRVPVVLCDSAADWRGLLESLRELANPPFLIVTSRLADDRLWSEALNLGAYDVLAKPFDRAEVTRVLSMAWSRWSGRSTKSFRGAHREGLTVTAFA